MSQFCIKDPVSHFINKDPFAKYKPLSQNYKLEKN